MNSSRLNFFRAIDTCRPEESCIERREKCEISSSLTKIRTDSDSLRVNERGGKSRPKEEEGLNLEST